MELWILKRFEYISCTSSVGFMPYYTMYFLGKLGIPVHITELVLYFDYIYFSTIFYATFVLVFAE